MLEITDPRTMTDTNGQNSLPMRRRDKMKSARKNHSIRSRDVLAMMIAPGKLPKDAGFEKKDSPLGGRTVHGESSKRMVIF